MNSENLSPEAALLPSGMDSDNRTMIVTCVRFPPKIHSMGIWGNDKPLAYPLPALEMQMVVIFALTQLLHFPLQRLGIPRLLSEIMAGMILGSTFLGRYENYQELVFPIEGQSIVGTLSSFGFMLFYFISGVRMDVSMIKKTGAKAWVFGLSNAIVPLAAGLLTTHLLIGSLGKDHEPDTIKNLPIIVVTHAATCFPVIAQLLKDVKILNSELGRLALSSTLISHMFGVIITSVSNVITIARKYSAERAFDDLMLCLLYVGLAIFVVRPAMVWMAKQTPEGRPVNDLHIYLIILGAFISAVVSHYFELSVIFGPFIFGLAVPEGPPLGSALIDKLDSFASGILLPLFVSTTTLRTNLRTINFLNAFAINNIVLVVVNFFTKVFACLVPALYCKMPFNDALALSLIMSAKGVVDLAKYSFLRDKKTLCPYTFALVVIATTLNAGFVPVLVKWLYNPSRKYAGYQKRNIMHTKQNGKLHIFVCIHRSDNIAGVTRLLDASTPSTESPIAVYALHLIELRGRATPIFISHQLQKKTVANLSYSKNVILAFNHYERNHWGAVTVQTFTAISPRQLMHEDICTLALDTLSSIMIIPFHRQWATDGSIEAEDLSMRALNRSVLERAPCSIGILVDRGHIRQSNSTWLLSSDEMYHVAVIFIGGCDDQEALVYAKRMAKNPSISLTVVHLVSMDGDEKVANDRDKVLDHEVLDDIKLLSSAKNVTHVKYVEKRVNGGQDTALVIRGMVDEHDLIIVGRRHNVESPETAGLEVWSEFPELGVVGDLLASSDLKGKASVLVVQQQQQMNH